MNIKLIPIIIISILFCNIITAELTPQEKEERRIYNNKIIKEAQEQGKLYELSKGEVILTKQDVYRLIFWVTILLSVGLIIIIYIFRKLLSQTKFK